MNKTLLMFSTVATATTIISSVPPIANISELKINKNELNSTAFQRAVEKLKFYNGWVADEHWFDLGGMSDYQTWGNALDKLRQHFASDPDFEGVKWEIVTPNFLIKYQAEYRDGEGKLSMGVRIWKDSGEDSGHFLVQFKNIISAKANMTNAIKKLQFFDGSSEEHYFDLEAMSDDQLWENALIKLRQHFDKDPNFANVQWEIIGPSSKINSSLEWKEKNKTSRGVRIWIEKEHSVFINVQFKNIFRKTNFDYAVEKLKFYSGWVADEHWFDLENMRGDQLWKEALEKVKNYFANDPDFQGIKWEIFGSEMQLNSAIHWRGEGKTYSWIRVWKDSGEDSGHFSFQFQNIIRTNTELENAIKKLQFFNGSDDEHHFNLEGMTGDQLWKDAFGKLYNHFATDPDFRGLEWSIDKPEITLKSWPYWLNGKAYQTLWIGKNGVIVNSFIVYFKNVVI